MDYRELSVVVRPEAVEATADLLRRFAPGGVSIEPPFEVLDEDGGVTLTQDAPVRLRVWVSSKADSDVGVLRGELKAMGGLVVRPLRARTVQDSRWVEAWKRHFKVLRVGRRLVLRPSWRRHRARRDDVVVELDPGMAFGTGQHPTTRMCLEALEDRLSPGDVVLDVGSGSGVLSVAAALLGASRVDAIDTDPMAVAATKLNAARNAVAETVGVAEGSLGEEWPFAGAPRGAYDLVLGNLSSRVIQELAGGLVGALSARGVALLSGVIAEQEAAVSAALTTAGGYVEATRGAAGWRLLTVIRAVAP